MARSLSLSLSKTLLEQKQSFSPSRLLSLRSQSTINNNNNNNNPIDLSETDTSSFDLFTQKLEDAIQRIIVQKSQPDWVPFVPGSSYWIPPQISRAYGVDKLVEKLVVPLSEEETLSTVSSRGWPSADYFIRGTHPTKIEE